MQRKVQLRRTLGLFEVTSGYPSCDQRWLPSLPAFLMQACFHVSQSQRRIRIYTSGLLTFSGIFQASALIFFAFSALRRWSSSPRRQKIPKKNIPRGLIPAISASIVLYMMVALSAVSVLGWERLSHSAAPFAEIACSALGPSASTLVLDS